MEEEKLEIDLVVKKGNYQRLGVTKEEDGINFAVAVAGSHEVKLVLYKKGSPHIAQEIPFPKEHLIGDILAIKVCGLRWSEYEYNYWSDGQIFQDPYAQLIVGREHFGEAVSLEDGDTIRCGFAFETYDWMEDTNPQIPYQEIISYQLHVRGFTRHNGSKVRHKGTFLGLQEKIPYLRELGINQVKLMPAYEFDEIKKLHAQMSMSYEMRQEEMPRVNYWGYEAGNYFAPKKSYGASKDVIREFKDLVRTMHANGMEVIMEFYFPNQINPRLIMDCLTFWVTNYHIDGFHILADQVLCNMLAKDPLLSRTKIMAVYFPTEEFYSEPPFPEFENLAYSIYCSVYVSEHTHDAVLQLVDRLRGQDFLCEYMQESEYIYMLQIFLSDKEKLLHIGSCFTDFIAQQNEYTFLYIENIFPVTTDWKPYYTRCLHLLTERYFSRESNLCISYSHPERPGFSEELLKMRKHFITVLHAQNRKDLLEYLETLFLSISQKKNSEYLSLVIHEIFVVYHVYFHIPENLAQPVTEFSASILDTEHSLENLKNEVLFYGLQCIQKMEAVPSDIALCRRIMEYIGNHYTDASLSVSQVAANFQLHPSYLGSVFKKVQHISVLQYISDIRISAAQKLLKEGTMKISEVAETSGYSDVYYFSKKFKKACGCSPKEYAAKYS